MKLSESEEIVLGYSKFVAETSQEVRKLIEERVSKFEPSRDRLLLASRIIMSVFAGWFQMGLYPHALRKTTELSALASEPPPGACL